MWISRKEYKFLKENAEKNINAECEILKVKENQRLAVARAMEEYSAVLEERDRLRLQIIELENKLAQSTQRGQRTKCNLVDDAIDISLVEPIRRCIYESDHNWQPNGISSAGDSYICSKCGAKRTYPVLY